MAQRHPSPRMPSNNELGDFTKPQLVAFLKSRGVPHTGNKAHLVSLAKLYANRPEVISDPEVTFKPEQSLRGKSVSVTQLTRKAYRAARARRLAHKEEVLLERQCTGKLNKEYSVMKNVSTHSINLEV